LGKATEEQLNNPLHGVKLLQILEHLVEKYGWDEMANRTNIRAFRIRPTIKSSLRFIRKTEWAKEKVQNLYIESLGPKIHASVPKMWNEFIAENPDYESQEQAESWYFCDNEKDAKECAKLVQEGKKQATSTSLWWFEKHNEALPQIGDVYIVTDWYGIAKAIIKTHKVEQIPYKEITEAYAAIEGEGDQSLEYWKKVHWDYYTREMEEFDEIPTEDMVIVCEQFETIWGNK